MARKKKPTSGAGSPLSAEEIIRMMDDSGLNPSCSRVTSGRVVVYSRDRRY
jgi:hypothetical protein